MKSPKITAMIMATTITATIGNRPETAAEARAVALAIHNYLVSQQ